MTANAETLHTEIVAAEAALMAHAPDPFSGWCHTCRVPGLCPAYSPAARRLGDLRAARDQRGTS